VWILFTCSELQTWHGAALARNRLPNTFPPIPLYAWCRLGSLQRMIRSAVVTKDTSKWLFYCEQIRPPTKNIKLLPPFCHLAAISRISFGRPQLQHPTPIGTLAIDLMQQEWRGYLTFYRFNSSQVTPATMRAPINHVYYTKGLEHTPLRKRGTSTNSQPQLIWPEWGLTLHLIGNNAEVRVQSVQCEEMS
jgi:hypothetical protein